MPTLPVPPSELAIALVLATLGATLQGSVGLGLAVVAAPILLLVNPLWVPGPMLLAALVLVMLIAYRDRAHIIVPDVALATTGRVLGTIPAAYLMNILPTEIYDLAFSGLVLAGVLLSVTGWHIARTPRNVICSGIFSGVASTISAVGGPPMALIYQHDRGPSVRGTMSAIFILGTIISISGLWWAGHFTREQLLMGLALLPGIFVGFALSRFTAARLDLRHTRPAILTVSALSALTILFRAIYNLL
ncbi:MAG: TSUP family transporter [Pirellulales bacterium]